MTSHLAFLTVVPRTRAHEVGQLSRPEDLPVRLGVCVFVLVVW